MYTPVYSSGPEEIKYVVSHIDDGDLFETFAQHVLSAVIGPTFVPHGGLKDQGIDGLNHIIHPEGKREIIYQISTSSRPEDKIYDSVKKLQDNGISYSQMKYITNEKVSNKESIAINVFDEYGANVQCRDVDWLKGIINNSSEAYRYYEIFVDKHLHEYITTEGKKIEINDDIRDPRVYVYLRQQWDDSREGKNISNALTDGLIMYALEGTDPDKGNLMSKKDIINEIKEEAPPVRYS